MRSARWLSLVILGVTGCAAGNFSSAAPLALPSSAGPSPIAPSTNSSSFPSTPVTSSAASTAYHAFGDSITFGATLSSPSTQAYPVLVGQAAGLSVTDRGTPGDLACDVSGFAILPYADSPSATAPLHYSIMIGTNDADFSGAGAHELDYIRCLQGSIAWVAVPTEFKMLVNNVNVTSTGSGQRITQDGITTESFQTVGDSISFAFQMAFAAPVYVWYRMSFGNPGAFSWSVDGGTGGTAVSGEYTTQIGTHGFTSAMALLRIPSIPAGSHVLTLTETIAAPSGMSIVGIGVAPPAGQIGLSRVLAGTIPRQLQGGGSPCDLNSALCPAFTADVTAAVTLFSGDGLNVHLFDSRAYTTGSAADMNDTVHPNQLGHREIAHAVEDVLN